MNPDQLQIDLVDQQPTPEMFLEEVLAGLREPEKRLPCKYFYDGRGSELFDEICELRSSGGHRFSRYAAIESSLASIHGVWCVGAMVPVIRER